MNCNRVDLRKGVVILTDGQRVPIMNYFSKKEPCDQWSDWAETVVAGPDADGNWLVVAVTDEDREDARTTP